MGKIKDEEQVSSNHVIVSKADDVEAKVEPVEVPKILEDGNKP